MGYEKTDSTDTADMTFWCFHKQWSKINYIQEDKMYIEFCKVKIVPNNACDVSKF